LSLRQGVGFGTAHKQTLEADCRLLSLPLSP
jgi:hypothetical protein